MYPVSDAYLTARRSRVREERITGGIRLKDGTIIVVDDTVIIQNSLSITKKVCSPSKFDIGTMNCSVLEMKLIDDSAYDHEFGGAFINLKYEIVTGTDDDGNKIWEKVQLPPFIANGSEVTRKRNVVSITAYDPISRLNIDYPDTIPTDDLYTALKYVCFRAGVGLAISEEDFNKLPNSGVKPDFSSAQVETCLDAAMWIAQTVNCCGFVDHRGLIDLRQYNYSGGSNYDRLFTEDEIKNIAYSDTRTYLAYLQAYVNGEARLYSDVREWTDPDSSHIKEGALSLPKNPILSKLTEEEQSAVNSSYLENRSYPTRYIKMTGWVDPALELMDVVAFSGSMIDVGQIVNVATQIKWCYGKSGTIYCASIAENSEAAWSESTASVMALEVTEEETSDSVNRMQPKSQIEKRLDAIEKVAADKTTEKLQTGGSPYALITGSEGIKILESDVEIINIRAKGSFHLKKSEDYEFYADGGYGFYISAYPSMPKYAMRDNSLMITEADGIYIRANSSAGLRIETNNIEVRVGADDTTPILIKAGSDRIYVTGGELFFNGSKVLLEES